MRRYILILLLFILAVPTAACAGWLIYHKPAFEGQVLDGETKEPIEGAVVVALYTKETIGMGAGTLSSTINVREVITDKNGHFFIPPYTTLIQPFSWESKTNFIIYKPGYVALGGLYDSMLESLFSGRMEVEKERQWIFNHTLKFRYRPPNIVELPKPKANDEKIRSLPSVPGSYVPKRKIKKLIELYNVESVRLKLGKIDFI